MPMPAWLKPPRRPLYALLVVAMVALAAWAFRPRPLAVESAAIAKGPLVVGFTEEGRTRLRDRYVVSAPLDGVVERIELEPGDEVAGGSVVAMLQPASAALFDPASRAQAEARWKAAQSAVAAAGAAIDAASAERARALAERRRAESLAADQLIARSELDAVRARAVAADAELRAARARASAATVERDGARAVLDLQGKTDQHGQRLPLLAPVSGRVVRRTVESEAVVRAGQPLLEIGDPQALEVVADILTSDAVRISPGTEVLLLRWGGAGPLRGRVRMIEPGGFTKVSALGVEEQRVVAVIDLLDPPARRASLGDGFRVDVDFIVWQSASVLTVPTAALFRDGPHWAVYVIEQGRARLRRVDLGRIGNEGSAELRGGLVEGTRVVLYPGDIVRDGVRVEGPDA